MRRLALFTSVAFVLSYPTNVFGSTLLVYLSPTEAILASDSLANRIEGGPSRDVCKIVQVSRNMFFAATGTGVVDEPHFDPYGLARDIGASSSSPTEAAREYSQAALTPLQRIWRKSRDRFFEVASQNGLREPRGPQDYVFVGFDSDKNLSAAGASFVETAPASKKLKPDLFKEFHGKDEHDIFLGRYGMFDNIPDNSEFIRLKQEIGTAEALKRFVEIQIGATPSLVGPPVVILVVRRNGAFEWLNRGPCEGPPD